MNKYGVEAGTVADVQGENDARDSLKAHSVHNGRHVNLPHSQQGSGWEWLLDEDDGDGCRKALPLNGTILGGVLGCSGGHWVGTVVDGRPGQSWVHPPPSAPSELVGATLGGDPVVGKEEPPLRLCQILPRAPGSAQAPPHLSLKSGVVVGGLLISIVLLDGRRIKIEAASMRIARLLEAAGAPTPLDSTAGRVWTDFRKCLGMLSWHDLGATGDQERRAWAPRAPPPPPWPCAAEYALLVRVLQRSDPQPVELSLPPPTPPPSRGQQARPPPRVFSSVVVGSVVRSAAVCTSCPWSLLDKFALLSSEFGQPVGVSLAHISTLDVSDERLYVRLQASMSPTATHLVNLRTPQEEWVDGEGWVPKKCPHHTAAKQLGHLSDSSSWAHRPNCLSDGELGVVVIWVIQLVTAERMAIRRWASGKNDLAALLPMWLVVYIRECCGPRQLPSLDAKHADLHAKAVEHLKANGFVFRAPCGPPVSPCVRRKKPQAPASRGASPEHADSELPEHCAVFYSTCEQHCPGHMLRRNALASSWHSFADLVRQCQSKWRQTDLKDDERAAEQKKREQLSARGRRQSICGLSIDGLQCTFASTASNNRQKRWTLKPPVCMPGPWRICYPTFGCNWLPHNRNTTFNS